MGISPVNDAHSALAALAGQQRFRFYELLEGGGTYAAAALAEHPDCLELHLEVLRYGPQVARALRRDVAELAKIARELGKTRVVGLRQAADETPDPRWFKFTRLFGFTGQRVLQAAELRLD